MAKKTNKPSKEVTKDLVKQENVVLPENSRRVLNKDLICNEVADLMLKQGYTKRTVAAYLVKKYKISETYAYGFIRKTNEKLSVVYNEMYTTPLQDALLFTESLKEKAMEDGDIKLTLEIQKELNKLNQLYVEKQMITLKPEQPLFKDEL